MIISRTPFRLSLFGGGSDYPEYSERYGGAILGFAINKYCYVTYRRLPRFFPHANRIVYSRMEHTATIDEIVHPGVRETLKYKRMANGVEIHHDGDLPARTGIGSSSAFIVGLLNVCYAAENREVDAKRLATEAYHVERIQANEIGGCQDQILTAHGGFQYFTCTNHCDYTIKEHKIKQERIDWLLDHLMLIYTGECRDSMPIAASYQTKMEERRAELHRTHDMVFEALEVLRSDDILHIGSLLHEGWELKKRRGTGVSTPAIDELYSYALANGARGGKITGAGGAGFMLLFVPPDDRDRLTMALESKGYASIPFAIEPEGSKIIFNNENAH